MRWKRCGWIGILCGLLAALLAPERAWASEFSPPVSLKIKRLLLGSYVADWEVSGLSLGNGQPTLGIDAAPGPLFTADYGLSKEWSVGAWFNPLSLEGRKGGRQVLDGSADFWEIHVTRYFPHGWAAQLGWTQLSEDYRAIRDIPGAPGVIAAPKGTRFEKDRGSFNLWLSRTERLNRGLRPVTGYSSFGFYPSDDFDHAFNLILGASVSLSPTLQLNGSAWLFNLTERVETRLTLGLTANL